MIDGPLQGSPDESCRGGRCACDRTLRSTLYCELYAAGAGDSALSHWLFFAASRPLLSIARGDSNTGRLAARRQLATVQRSSEALAVLVAGTHGVHIMRRLGVGITGSLGVGIRGSHDVRITRPLDVGIRGSHDVRITRPHDVRITGSHGVLFACTLGIVPLTGDLGEHQLQPLRERRHFNARVPASHRDGRARRARRIHYGAASALRCPSSQSTWSRRQRGSRSAPAQAP
jgi:hypothetical protein